MQKDFDSSVVGWYCLIVRVSFDLTNLDTIFNLPQSQVLCRKITRMARNIWIFHIIQMASLPATFWGSNFSPWMICCQTNVTRHEHFTSGNMKRQIFRSDYFFIRWTLINSIIRFWRVAPRKTAHPNSKLKCLLWLTYFIRKEGVRVSQMKGPAFWRLEIKIFYQTA